MKITVLGLNASGKSTLASKISQKLSIPHIHLDRFWFEAGGLAANKTTPLEIKQKTRQQIRDRVEEIISKEDKWVSDGIYSRVKTILQKKQT